MTAADMLSDSFEPVAPTSGRRRDVGQILAGFNPTLAYEARKGLEVDSMTQGGRWQETLPNAVALSAEPLFILDPPRQDPPAIGRFEVEQEFEGIVLAIDPDGEIFTARLVDISNNGPDEEAEFSLREITDDRHLVVPGAMFSWTIGLQWRKRQCTRVSEIRFRRLPAFSKEAIERAEARALELAAILNDLHDAPFSPAAR